MTQERVVYRGSGGQTLNWTVLRLVLTMNEMGLHWYIKSRGILEPEASQALWNHSPDGFSWGFGGSGPHQLSIALLMEAGATDEEARWKFKGKLCRDVVSRWDKDQPWEISYDRLHEWLEQYRAEQDQSELESARDDGGLGLICGNPHCVDGFSPRQTGPDPGDVDMEPCPICGGP